MNYHQTIFSPSRKQSPEEMEKWRKERKIRLTNLMKEAKLNKNQRLVDEYKHLIGRV
jgi:hypothetical protein